uniref:Uncharacterized protein n=1 Tax=Meloidogyne hapla TaxID=6305 RepID=A0A1I8BFH4_MELHA
MECAISKGKEKVGEENKDEKTDEYELGRGRVGQRPPTIHISNEDLIKANLEAKNGKEMKEHIKMWPNKGTNFMRASGLIESKAVEHQSGQVGETSSKRQTEHGESSGTEISKFERMIEENQGLNEEEMEEQLKALPVHNFDNFMKREIRFLL